MASRAAMVQEGELPISYERRMWARQWLLRREQIGSISHAVSRTSCRRYPGVQRIYEDALFKIRGFGRTDWAIY